jgi:hypothetical protein
MLPSIVLPMHGCFGVKLCWLWIRKPGLFEEHQNYMISFQYAISNAWMIETDEFGSFMSDIYRVLPMILVLWHRKH